MKTKLVLITALLLVSISCKKDKPSIDLQKGLVSYFNFDDNLKDQQGYFSDGVGFPSFISVKGGSALSFDGVNQKLVLTPQNPLKNTQFSISLWVNTDGGKFIVGQNQAIENFGISFLSGQLFCGFKTIVDTYDGVITNFNKYSQKWACLILTFDGKTLNLYVNGELSASNNSFVFKSILDQTITLGYSPGFGYTACYIDELRLYNRALSQAEVTQLYNLK